MKNAIIKFLGLDKIQQENAYLINKVDNLSKDLYTKDWTYIASDAIDYSSLAENIDVSSVASYIEASSIAEYIDDAELAEYIDASELAEYIDNESVAEHLSSPSIASYIEPSEVAEYVSFTQIAEHIDNEGLAYCVDAEKVADYISMDNLLEHANINIDTLAEQVAERIADRDGMHQLVSEEIENQNVGITQDAVQSMIDTAIQQFGDSLEVMVSAKLNINK